MASINLTVNGVARSDAFAAKDCRRHLLGVLVSRALQRAVRRAPS